MYGAYHEILARTTHAVSLEVDEEPKQIALEAHSDLWRDIITYYIKHGVSSKEELETACKKLEKAVFYEKLKSDICRAQTLWAPPFISEPHPVQNF